jgi:acetylornithine deacetylase/succinyl-diaminopimelate desuccinylase-like protein
VSNHETAGSVLIEERLADLGIGSFRQYVTKDRFNVIARIGPKSSSSLLLNSHVDTVPPSPRQIVSSDHQRVYGRGACDAKASIASIILALASLEKYESYLDRSLTAAFVVGEEVSGDGTERLFELGKNFEACIVGEPTKLRLCDSQSGCLGIKIVIESEESHGFSPKGEQTALSTLIEIVHALRNMPRISVRNQDAAKEQLFVRALHSGKMDRFWINPSTATTLLLFNPSPNHEPKAIMDDVAAILRGYSGNSTMVKFKVLDQDRGVVPKRTSQIRKAVQKALNANNKAIDPGHMSSWTDASIVTANGVDTVIFGPGDLGVAHTHHENVAIADVSIASRVYAQSALIYSAEANS